MERYTQTNLMKTEELFSNSHFLEQHTSLLQSGAKSQPTSAQRFLHRTTGPESGAFLAGWGCGSHSALLLS